MTTTLRDHWLNGIIDPECRSSNSLKIDSQVFSVTHEGETWTLATDGRICVAIHEDIGAPRFEGSAKIDPILKPLSVAPVDDTWELLRGWAGPPQRICEVECGKCYGCGTLACDECGSMVSCGECDGEKKVIIRPEQDAATLGGRPLDKVYLSRGLAGGQTGPCKVYVPPKPKPTGKRGEQSIKAGATGMIQIRDDRCIVTLALLFDTADVVDECGQSYEDWRAKESRSRKTKQSAEAATP